MESTCKARVLVAPMNWGLGHASRCIPIIEKLIELHYEPIIASDGAALELLKKEFPDLKALALASYDIEYPRPGETLKWKMLRNAPKTVEAVRKENQQIAQYVEQYQINGIISDNRWGVFHHKVPSVIISHQLNVLSGNTTWFTGKIHRQLLAQFSECWVPDVAQKPSLSGKLGHLKSSSLNIQYIGPLSRFKSEVAAAKKYKYAIVLSGPEPQRTLLEEKLTQLAMQQHEAVVLVRGVIESVQTQDQLGPITRLNYATAEQLQDILASSEILIARSGYSTIMDLTKFSLKAFFIPTPGQYEQEYLAEKMQRNGYAPYATQTDFEWEELERLKEFTGIPPLENKTNWKRLLCLFDAE